MPDLVTSAFSRVFSIEGRAAPNISAVYQGLWKAGTPTFPFGDVTTSRIPNPDQYGGFLRVGKIIGNPGDPSLPISARFTYDLSTLLRIGRNGCDNDIQVHFGQCEDPRNFNAGWQSVLIIEAGRIDQWTTDADLGALSPDENSLVSEQVTFIGNDMYQVKRLAFAEVAGAAVIQEILSITVCDRVSCGSCGIASDGCDKVFAVSVGVGGSPGLGAAVVYSGDGGGTWASQDISTLAANSEPTDIGCVGTNIVVPSDTDLALHYAPTADILAGTSNWTRIATGFVVAKGPRAIASVGPSVVFIVGTGGYIYGSSDITSGVTVLDAGVATAQNLSDVHAFDTTHAVAVGASNAVVKTTDGIVWSAVTGPAVGIQLNSVFMLSNDIWFVGTNTGLLYTTTNGGVTWTLKGFPGSGSGVIKDIKFPSRSVGYMSHTSTTPRGRILRTIDGGNSWYVLPEGTGSMPANQRIDSLAICSDVNQVFAGGLSLIGLDGIIVRGA